MHSVKDVIDDDFRMLLHALLDVTKKADSERVEKGERGLNALGLCLKAFYHFSAIFHMAQGTKVSFLSLEYEDPGSIPVLLRAAWESALVFSYVFADPPSESESILRYAAWRLSGLLSRQKLEAISKWGQKIKDEDSKFILKLQNEIRSHNLFNNYTNGEQSNILYRGQWRLPVFKGNNERKIPSWNDIAIDAGLSKKSAYETYNYLSCYAHSSYLSVFQLIDADTSANKRILIDGLVSISKIVMALIARKYVKVFPKGEMVLRRNQDYAKVIDTWCDIGSQEAEDMVIDWDEEFEEE